MILHTRNLLKALSSETVKNMVKSELETYDADKTGRTDYALENSGGEILSTRDTELYSTGASVLNFFGTPRCQQQNTPRAVIQTGVLPGECWAFKGSSGSIVIRLLGYVHVSGISLEHISSLISPTGETDTAPRDFSVWNRAIQPYEIIEMKVHSNSGNPEYTCIYRIRVHGTLAQAQL
ncbi:SUN domain-containing protein 1-like isoform X2 [Harpegnathos saltator]|nr:SUN domain-containing protein 1-like isoform X2 [Harpegnathos saltator]